MCALVPPLLPPRSWASDRPALAGVGEGGGGGLDTSVRQFPFPEGAFLLVLLGLLLSSDGVLLDPRKSDITFVSWLYIISLVALDQLGVSHPASSIYSTLCTLHYRVTQSKPTVTFL